MVLENLTFKGGMHVKEYKELTNGTTEVAPYIPAKVVIPLQQHIGAPCESLVAVGDLVKVGQKIGEAKSNMSAPVHSSVSGKVTAIEAVETASGNIIKSIVIENDGSDSLGYETGFKDYEAMNVDEILAIIKEAGITGLGGASFPTHIKLSPPPNKPIDTVIVNGAECEPYVTCDEMNLLNAPEKIIAGLKIAMKAVGAQKGYVAIEDNKKTAQDAVAKLVGANDNIEVASLKTKYPQGDEKRIIDAVLHRHVPSGGLPMDVGVVVINTSTALAIAEAVLENKPLYERIVTITGHAVKEPKNLRARIGTSYAELIQACGGFSEKPGKIIMGGPMMGKTQSSLSIPLEKGANGILVMTVEEAAPPQVSACIKCGKCLEVCPVGLEPVFIHQRVNKEDYEGAEQIHILDCIECGSCSFVCPAKRPLVESFRLGKAEIKKNRQNR